MKRKFKNTKEYFLLVSTESSDGLNSGQFCPLGDIWHCLYTLLVVPTGGLVGVVLLSSGGYRLLNILEYTRQPPTTKTIQPKTSIVPRLKLGDTGVGLSLGGSSSSVHLLYRTIN